MKIHHTFCYNSKSLNSNELSLISFVPLIIGWDHYLCEMSGYLLSQQKLRAQAWWLIKNWHRKSDPLRIVVALCQTSSYWLIAHTGTFESLFYIGHTPRACFGIKQFTCGLRADDDICASFSMLGRCREEATSYTCSYYVRLRVCRPTVLAILSVTRVFQDFGYQSVFPKQGPVTAQ